MESLVSTDYQYICTSKCFCCHTGFFFPFGFK